MSFQPARIREAREAMRHGGRRVTQETFADLVGVSRRSPSRWENGEAAPRMAQLTRIAEVTGRPVSFFFDDAPAPASNGELMATLLDQVAEGLQSKAAELRTGDKVSG